MRNKKFCVFCVAAACALALGGCGLFSKTETSTVELDKKGGITETVIEDFSDSEYDFDEFSGYVDDAVSDYSEAGSGTVELKENKLEEGVITFVMKYDSPDTYSAFNNLECFAGSADEAEQAGYDFNMEFTPAEGADEGLSGEAEYAADGTMVASDSSLSLFIVRTSSDVKVPGKVRYYYTESGTAALSGTDTVTISTDETTDAAGSLVCVFYE